MQAVTKQDMQTAIDSSRNIILQRIVSRQDIEASRDRVISYAHDLHTQTQQVIRQANYQNVQLTRKIAVLEARLMSMEHDIKTTNQLLARLAEHPQPIIMPASADTGGQLKYVYKPA